jgi:thioredoxin reductase (NADPH)
VNPVVVIGAGPCGIAAGVALKEAGLPALLIEKGTLAQSIVNYPTKLVFFSTPEKLVVGGVPFSCAGERPTRQEGIDNNRLVAAEHELSIMIHERVSRITRDASGLQVHHAKAQGAARITAASAVVVATGYFDYPNLLGVPGENLPHVSHRFVDGDNARGRTVLVVGGGNSAVECAMELARCGARPTIVHYEAGFVSHVIKPWIMPEFERQVAAGEIALRWNTRVTGIDSTRVRVVTDGVTDSLQAELVYLMTGYTPRPGLLGELGVPSDEETGIPAHNPETMETSVPAVFVAGVLTSGKKANGVFIENGRGHGTLIARALASR